MTMSDGSKDRLFLYRLPAVALGAVYAALFYFYSGQVADVLREAAPRYASFLLTFIVPSLAISAFHIVFIARMTRPLRWIDPILAALPFIAMGIMIILERDTSVVVQSLPTLAMLAMAIGATILMAGWLQARAGRLAPWAFAVAGATYAACLALTVVFPVPFPQLLQPLGVVALGFGLISVLIAALQLNKVIGLALTAVFVLSLLFDGSVHDVRRLLRPSEATAATPDDLELGTQLAAWLHARKDRAQYAAAGRPYPVILVSAEGGGIYAAAHTFAAMTGMQRYCPGFAQHMFAATGVSGGSFGLALFAATLEAKQQSELPDHCLELDETSTAPSAEGSPLLSDKLSPVLATLLFVEVLDALLPGRYLLFDRAEALELAFEAASPQDTSFLARDLRSTWSADGVTPALMFVTTDLKRGSRFIMSPIQADAMDTFAEWLPAGAAVELRVSTAAGASARFPWVTPSARLELGDNDARLLVDGGYFEDSGSETAIDVEREIERQATYTAACASDGKSYCSMSVVKGMGAGCRIVIVDNFTDPADWSGCNIPIYPVIVAVALYPDAPTGTVPDPDPANSQSFLTDPLTGILAARTGRGLLALGRLSQTMCERGGDCGAHRTFSDGGYFPLMLDASLLDLPLGWNISRQRLQLIFDDVARAGHCGRFAQDSDGDQLARDRFNARRRYACQLDQLAPLVDLRRTPELVPTD